MISPSAISPLNRRVVEGETFSFGNALQFDGVDDFVSFGGSNVLADPNSAWSVGVWTKLNSFSSSFPVICRLKSGVAGNPFAVLFSNNLLYNDLTIGSLNTFAKQRITIPTTFLNTWIYIAITYNGNSSSTASNFIIYINGSPISSTSASGLASSSDVSTLCNNVNGTFANIVEDEFAFWQQELTAGQVSNQWNGGNGNFANVDVTPLVWFRMNEADGATTAVNSGSGGSTYDGTLNNFSTPPAYFIPH